LPPGAIARLGSLRLYHGSHVNHVILSPDGKWVLSQDVTGFYGGGRLWDARTGKAQALADDMKGVGFFAAPDKLMAAKMEEGRVVLWDPVADKEVARLALDIAPGDPPALSPDGKTLVWWSARMVGGALMRKLVFADVAKGTVRQAVDVEGSKHVW